MAWNGCGGAVDDGLRDMSDDEYEKRAAYPVLVDDFGNDGDVTSRGTRVEKDDWQT